MDDILEYEKMVYSIIKKYNSFDKEDLYQVGMMALVNAYKNYNNNFDTKFSTYAYYYILGEVNKYIRESRTIKVGKDVLKLNRSIEKAREVMRQKLGREATTLELSLFLEVDEEKIIMAEQYSQSIKSLDYCYDDEDVNLYNSISVEDHDTNPVIMDLKSAINSLDEDEKELIKSRYFDDLTQSEIGRMNGMSQVQISRKETKVLQKLRSSL